MIPASHPDIWQDHVNQILMTKQDQDRLTEICLDPRNKEVMCRYAAILTNDIASHRHVRDVPEENQIIGRVIQRELPINAHHIRHGWSSAEGEMTQEDENYIGMPIPVSFEKNLGLKKTTIPQTIHINPVHLKEDCKCGRKTCICNKNKTKVTSNGEKYKRVASKDLKAKKLEERKAIFSKYTTVDPSINVRISAQIGQAAKRKMSKERYFEPKKYVLEQITSQRVRPMTTTRTKHMVSLEDSTERIANMRPITPSRDSMITKVRTTSVIEPSQKIPILEEMVEMMDMYMKNQKNIESSSKKAAPSISTKDFSVQADLQPIVPEPAFPKKPLASHSDYKVQDNKKSKIIKEVSSTKKIVRVIERQYELDKDSFEISELIQHVPSRVMSLSSPVEKKLRRVDVTQDPMKFNTTLYSPENVGIVDEHLVEFERRKVIERIIEQPDL